MENAEYPPDKELAQPVSAQAGRPLTSVLIFIHLFCVFVVLFGNQLRSDVQDRVMKTLAPYTQTFYFDPPFVAGFHLTHALEFEDDHYFELETADGLLRLPDAEQPSSNSFERLRLSRSARQFAFFLSQSNEDLVAEMAASICNGLLVKPGDRLVLRLIRKEPMDWQDVADRMDFDRQGGTFNTLVYTADAWRDATGQVNVYQRVEPREASPPIGLSQPANRFSIVLDGGESN